MDRPPVFTSLSPVLIVDDVAASVAFWRDTLGFVAENEVPNGEGGLIFASVRSGSVEIMYQSRASVLAENPGKANELAGHSTVLFLQLPTMNDLDRAERATAGAPVEKARRGKPAGGAAGQRRGIRQPLTRSPPRGGSPAKQRCSGAGPFPSPFGERFVQLRASPCAKRQIGRRIEYKFDVSRR